MKISRLKVAGIIIVLMALSMFTWALQHSYFVHAKAPIKRKAPDTLYKEPVYSKALFTKFETLCKKYDTLRKNYTLAGVINTIDKADTMHKANNALVFLFCKQGNDFYYRSGKTETINANGLYLYIDHQVKTIMLAEQKPIVFENGLSSMTSLAANLKSEDYKLSSNAHGVNQTINLINEHHISCKQYSVSFDTLNMQINRIYARLTNLNEPLRKDNEKIVDVRITEWNNIADLKKYRLGTSVVKKQNNEWKAIDAFADYQLIKM